MSINNSQCNKNTNLSYVHSWLYSVPSVQAHKKNKTKISGKVQGSQTAHYWSHQQNYTRKKKEIRQMPQRYFHENPTTRMDLIINF